MYLLHHTSTHSLEHTSLSLRPGSLSPLMVLRISKIVCSNPRSNSLSTSSRTTHLKMIKQFKFWYAISTCIPKVSLHVMVIRSREHLALRYKACSDANKIITVYGNTQNTVGEKSHLSLLSVKDSVLFK